MESTVKCRTYRLQHFLIAWESQQTLTRDNLITDANRKLAFLSAGSFDLSAKFHFE
jgi:hypothetical protein